MTPLTSVGLEGCAPAFTLRVLAVLDDLQQAGFDPVLVKSLTDDRRDWHGYGLAVDVVSQSGGTPMFWKALGGFATVHELATTAEPGHVQWGAMRETPSALSRALYDDAGRPAVWAEVGAA